MAKMDVRISVESNANDLFSRVNAMADYLDQAKPGDPFAEFASRIGEISTDDCSMSSEFSDGAIVVTVTPVGDLAELLNRFEQMENDHG